MSDTREALVAHLERVGMGYGLHDGLKREVLGSWADAILASFDVTPRGERVKPSVEDVRERMSQNWQVFKKHVPVGAYLPVGQMDGDCRECGGSWPCDAVLALLPGRTEREVKAEAWDEWASEGAWVCGRCGKAPKAHGATGPGWCVYVPVFRASADQGVTAEQAWGEGFCAATDAAPPDTWHAAWNDVPNPYRAAARPTGQEGS